MTLMLQWWSKILDLSLKRFKSNNLFNWNFEYILFSIQTLCKIIFYQMFIFSAYGKGWRKILISNPVDSIKFPDRTIDLLKYKLFHPKKDDHWRSFGSYLLFSNMLFQSFDLILPATNFWNWFESYILKYIDNIYNES